MLSHDTTPSALDDCALNLKLSTLLGREREILVAFLRHLAELDSRKLYLGLGYSSLFVYCRDHLHLSNNSAFRRYTSARLMARFPAIADYLLTGRLNLTRLTLLKEVLTQENHLDLLERATRGIERDVEALAASLKPKPQASDGIRRLPSSAGSALAANKAPTPRLPADSSPAPDSSPGAAPTPAVGPPSTTAQISSEAGTTSAAQPSSAAHPATAAKATTVTEASSAARPSTAGPASTAATTPLFDTSASPAAPLPRPHRMDIEATSGTTFSVRMTVGAEFVSEFEELRGALGHKVPSGNFEDVFRECFRIALEALRRKRAGATRKCGTSARVEAATPAPTPELVGAQGDSAPTATSVPRSVTSEAGSSSTTVSKPAVKPAEPSRYVPARVRRAVWTRDGDRCAFVSESGKRCDSTYQLEVHHIDPHARGGPPTVENLSLRCRAHNLYEAEVAFGADYMRSLPFWKCEDSARPSLNHSLDVTREPSGPH